MICKNMELICKNMGLLEREFQQLNNRESNSCLNCSVAGCDWLQHFVGNTWDN